MTDGVLKWVFSSQANEYQDCMIGIPGLITFRAVQSSGVTFLRYSLNSTLIGRQMEKNDKISPFQHVEYSSVYSIQYTVVL